MQYAASPETTPKTVEEAQAIATAQAQQLKDAQNTMVAPTEGVASIAPSTASNDTPPAASGVIDAMPVPTYTMASEFPVPVEETKTMAAGGLAGLKKGKYLDLSLIHI